LLYRSKYCPLHEAVQLIADRLAAADRQNYADTVTAIANARKQLLQALFEGAVRAEGVIVYPADPPADEPPSVEYDQWFPIDRGVWLHEKCEANNDVYRLNTILINWDQDNIDYYKSDGDWAEYMNTRIRLVCDDIDREFPAVDALSASVDTPVAPVKQDYRTGLRGRPSSVYLARQEMHRRAKEGIMCTQLAGEMRELCRWLQREHPNAPPTRPKSLGESLRHEYWPLKRGMDS
jgi:hypothetical protein